MIIWNSGEAGPGALQATTASAHSETHRSRIAGGRLQPFGEMCSIESRLVDPTAEQYRDLPHIGVERIESATGQLLPCQTAREDGDIKFLFTPEDIVLSASEPICARP